MLAAVLGASASGTVLAAFARSSWIGDLAANFPLHGLLVSALVTVVALLRRRYVLAALAVLVAVPNAWRVAPYATATLVPATVSGVRGQGSKIVALNVSYLNREYQRVHRYLDKADADLLVLSELTPAWVAELDAVTRRYPYRFSQPLPTPWGLGVYSRYPLRDARLLDLGGRRGANVEAIVELPGQAMYFVAAHLYPPTNRRHAELRNAQLRSLAGVLAAHRARHEAMPRMLIGDLNVTAFSPYFADLLDASGLQDAGRRFGLRLTWPTWLPPGQLQIDHCLADPAAQLAGVRRGAHVGSDHYPLEVFIGRTR
jgi:endonuclease/exonuclease/phosphatase (EEP) superfamily protein YafD